MGDKFLETTTTETLNQQLEIAKLIPLLLLRHNK